MHLGEISFCGKIGYNVKSDDYKQKVLDDLNTKVGFKVVQRHFDRFTENMVPNLIKNPHVLTVRTNGNPYLLYLTRYNYANQCIFIDKKIQHGYFYPRMIIVKMWFDDELFNDTLFDGEMVKTNSGHWEFIINDLISEKGQDFSRLNVLKRFNRVYEILRTMYRDDDLCCCKIRVKKIFTYDNIGELEHFISTLDYSCRGIYIKPLFLKFKDILINFDDSLVKKVVRMKMKDIQGSTFLLTSELPLVEKSDESSHSSDTEEKCTIPSHPSSSQESRVFFARRTGQPDIYELFSSNDSHNAEIACVSSLATSKMLRLLFAGCNLTEKKKVMCSWSEKFRKWVPLHEVA